MEFGSFAVCAFQFYSRASDQHEAAKTTGQMSPTPIIAVDEPAATRNRFTEIDASELFKNLFRRSRLSG